MHSDVAAAGLARRRVWFGARGILAALGLLIALTTLGLCGGARAGETPTVSTTDEAVTVTLPGEVVLTFARDGEQLLGMDTATVQGLALSSPETCFRPLLAQEWAKDRMAWPFLKFEEATVVDGAVQIRCTLLGTSDERAFRRLFVFTGDTGKVLAEGMTPELTALQAKAKAAQAVIAKAVVDDPELAKVNKEIADKEAALKTEKDKGEVKKIKRALKNLKRSVKKLPKTVRARLEKENDTVKAAKAEIDAFQAALGAEAIKSYGDLHRDYYRFALLRQPAEICRKAYIKESYALLKDKLTPGGELIWTLKPTTRNVAGWPWRGWVQSFAFTLPEGKPVNAIRTVGTWEVGGDLKDLTLVALRYRGLGGIEEKVELDGKGRSATAWSTTEIIPGAVGGAPLVSPVVPSGADPKDRGYALRHRAGAWIATPARGAGAPFVDFQYKPTGILASFAEKQGNLRALSEVYPEDATTGQIDEEFYPTTTKAATTPRAYIVLKDAEGDLPIHEAQTRWQEMDEHVRAQVAKELNFVRREPRPAIGFNFDYSWNTRVADMAKKIPEFHDNGVRMVLSHHTGWYNPRGMKEFEHPSNGKVKGGDCSIYDYKPMAYVQDAWKEMTANMATRDMGHYQWVTGMVIHNGAFAKRVGDDKKHWGLNAPNDEHGAGYGDMRKFNILDPTFKEHFLEAMEAARAEYGMQGIWADSFQNLFMSQLDWANGAGESQQRAWWEQIADWSRNGLAWMSESHAFPGMSCSIELHGWEKDAPYFRYTVKWLRGTSQRQYTPEQLNDLTYRFAANKAWIAPEKSLEPIPAFARIAKEYLAALPSMRRSWVLPDGKGMLWLPYDKDDEGVLYVFKEQKAPAGVTAAGILDKAGATDLKPLHTYTVKGADLVTAFGMTPAPEADPRAALKWSPAPLIYPTWATK